MALLLLMKNFTKVLHPLIIAWIAWCIKHSESYNERAVKKELFIQSSGPYKQQGYSQDKETEVYLLYKFQNKLFK